MQLFCEIVVSGAFPCFFCCFDWVRSNWLFVCAFCTSQGIIPQELTALSCGLKTLYLQPNLIPGPFRAQCMDGQLSVCEANEPTCRSQHHQPSLFRQSLTVWDIWFAVIWYLLVCAPHRNAGVRCVSQKGTEIPRASWKYVEPIFSTARRVQLPRDQSSVIRPTTAGNVVPGAAPDSEITTSY